VLEGVAFSLRDSFAIFEKMGVPTTQIRLGGGGARSALWRQIQADVYRHEVEVLQAEEGAAYGAAGFAGIAAGQWTSVDEACDCVVRVSARVTPVAANIDILRGRYDRFRMLYAALHPAR